jgi:hypothetical protein
MALLASLGIGGSLGIALGILKDPRTRKVLKYAAKAAKVLSSGEHLSEADKKFIRDYNSKKTVVDGYDYTEQLHVMGIMSRR